MDLKYLYKQLMIDSLSIRIHIMSSKKISYYEL